MNRYKATLILIIVTLGFLVSYPFHTTFIGGLINSGFCASMIGGFADWYGITALFRKPLGVSFRTEIIPKNREKIFNGLSDMVSEELLTKEHLKTLLKEYDTSKLIIRYISKNEEYEKIKKIISLMVEENLPKVNSDEINKISANLIRENLKKLDVWKIGIAIIEVSIKNGYDEKIINFVIDEIILFIKTEDFRCITSNLVDEIKNSYENGMTRRIILNAIVLDALLKLSSENISKVIQEKLVEYFYELKSIKGDNRLKLKQWIDLKFKELKENDRIRDKVEHWKIEQISNIRLENYIEAIIQSLAEKNKKEGIIKKVVSELELRLDNIKNEFIDNSEWKKKADNYIKSTVDKLIDNTHDTIGKLIKENLNKYSDKMLVDLIESKAGNDLQLIRINGSVVGGVVGILIFILTYGI